MTKKPPDPSKAAPYREAPRDAPTNIGPVACADCSHWTTRPMDCDVVPLGLKRRSTAVVYKHWLAADEGCTDFEKKLTMLERLARKMRL